MATLDPPKQGILDIGNVQGNYTGITLEFLDELDQPIDLTLFKEIKMEIKEIYSVKDCPFLTLDLNEGLTISGVGNNILSFSLGDEFWKTQTKNFVYDIVFVNQMDEAFNFIKGTLVNSLTATKPNS